MVVGEEEKDMVVVCCCKVNLNSASYYSINTQRSALSFNMESPLLLKLH